MHGYYDNEQAAQANSIDLYSNAFQTILSQFIGYNTTLILGLNERVAEKIYNTAVVIENGKLLGKMQKLTTYAPHNYYSLGSKYPIFYKNNIGFGICICCDINYFNHAHTLSKNGAQIIFCPMWNIIERTHGLLPHMQNKSHLLARAQENYAWFVGSDVTYNTEKEIGIGASCIIDPVGNIVATSQALTENIITYHISISTLDPKRRLLDRAIQQQKINTYCETAS